MLEVAAAVSLGATACAPTAGVRDGRHGPSARPPHLLFILADDLGWGDLSAYGRSDYATPVIDALAYQGVRLTQAYANSSVCTPTRVALLTGRYQQRLRVGVEPPIPWARWAPSGGFPGLPPEHPTIASLLKTAGYRTALIGKWHVGYLPQYGPLKSGFEQFFGIFGGGVDYFSHTDGAGDPDLWEGETPVQRVGYLTDLISDRAVDFIRRHARSSTPFYLSVNYTAPHWPWQGPGDARLSASSFAAQQLDGGSPAVFAEMVERLDQGLGRLLEVLDESAVSRDTLVVFTSDNGGERFSNMSPFAGRKGSVYEGGHRVPAIVRWPGVVPERSISQQVAMTFDWMATLLAAAGISPHPGYPLDGIDLLPLLKSGAGAASEPRQLFWRIGGQRAARAGDLKYLAVSSPEQVLTAGGASAGALGLELLFDLATDPGESVNLLALRPDDGDRLRAAWATWNANMLPVPRAL
jgi:arylsulfatase A-like enzyme